MSTCSNFIHKQCKTAVQIARRLRNFIQFQIAVIKQCSRGKKEFWEEEEGTFQHFYTSIYSLSLPLPLSSQRAFIFRNISSTFPQTRLIIKFFQR